MKILMPIASLLAVFTLALVPTALFAAGSSVLVTAISGQVELQAESGQQTTLQPFVKLHAGDRIVLAAGAKLTLVYLDSGREEAWSGGGRIEIGPATGLAQGLAQPRLRQLPEFLVRQVARMPALDGQERAGAVRLRNLPVAADRIDAEYRALRAQSDPADLNPELYRCAGLFELREFERLEQALAELGRARPQEAQADALVQFYREAIREARAAALR